MVRAAIRRYPAALACSFHRPSPATAQLEDFERTIGPFKIRERSFTVVLHMKRVKAPRTRPAGSEETVAGMDIRDESGRVHYTKAIAYEVEEDHFAETTEISARLLEGSQGSGLLITSDVEPSTPLGGGAYQVFGMFNDNLVPFSKPITMEGNLIQPDPPPEKLVKTSKEPGLQAEVVRFRVWSGNVFVVIPVRVDWVLAKVRPAWECYRMTARGRQPQCHFQVEADRRPPDKELSFVRLHAEPEEGMGIAEHVVIKKDSTVEILEAAGPQVWNEDEQFVGLSVGDDLWLKVRIDGKEGWIHTQEDFSALGLPQAG